MNRDELQELYDDGRLDSIHLLRNLRQEIREHTGLEVPFKPEDVHEWWDKKKAVFARKLKEDKDNQTEGDSE